MVAVFAAVPSAALLGVEGHPVTVEVHASTDDGSATWARHSSGRIDASIGVSRETMDLAGIRDRSIERLVQLAKRHGLHADRTTAAGNPSDTTPP